MHTCSECDHAQPLSLESHMFNFMKATCDECGHVDLYMVEQSQPGDTEESAAKRKAFYEKYERVKQGFRKTYGRVPFSDSEFKDFYHKNHGQYEADTSS